MKRLVLLFGTRRTCQRKSFCGWPLGILSPLLLLILGWQQIAVAQSDDFNDGNDTGWKLLDLTVVGSPATRTFPDDGFGGKAYRILSPAPPVPDAGPARAFSYQTNIYDNFYAAVDVVTWDNSLNHGRHVE